MKFAFLKTAMSGIALGAVAVGSNIGAEIVLDWDNYQPRITNFFSEILPTESPKNSQRTPSPRTASVAMPSPMAKPRSVPKSSSAPQAIKKPSMSDYRQIQQLIHNGKLSAAQERMSEFSGPSGAFSSYSLQELAAQLKEKRELAEDRFRKYKFTYRRDEMEKARTHIQSALSIWSDNESYIKSRDELLGR